MCATSSRRKPYSSSSDVDGFSRTTALLIDGQIVYRTDAIHPRHQANFRVFDPLDVLAEISAHIPDVHEKTPIFYGWYSNRTRGYRKQQGRLGTAGAVAPSPGANEPAPLEVRRSRARLIRKVYEVDPLRCPPCGGAMRVIAGIEQPAVVRQILDHLGIAIPSRAERPPPEPARSLAVAEAPARTYDPAHADLPVLDPLTV